MNTANEYLPLNSQGLQSQVDLLQVPSLIPGLSSTKPVPPALTSLDISTFSELSFPAAKAFSFDSSDQSVTTPFQFSLNDRSNRFLLSQKADEFVVGQLQSGDILTNFSSLAIAPSIPSTQEIVFIDKGVDNYQQIVAGINSTADIVVLDSDRDGIQQISDVLKQRQNIAAVHIISHGNQGKIFLGTTSLTASNLDQYSEQIQGWNAALTDTSDILLYGCDVALGETGKEFIQQLSQLSSADIAASDDLTGLSTLGGDWTLEYTRGSIEATTLKSNYQGVLFSMTIQDLYTAWQSNTLGSLNSLTLNLDSSSVLNGSLTIASNNASSLRLTGTSLSSFIGTGLSTGNVSDDRGLTLSNLNVDLLLNADSTYTYTFSGQAALNNLAGLTLSAEDVTAIGTQAGTTVNLTNFKLGLGNNAALGGETLSYKAQNNQLSFNGTNLFTFIGYGAETTDKSDDVGVEVNNTNFDLQFSNNAYNYTVSNGNLAIRGIDGLVVEAGNVSVTGDQNNTSVTTGAFSLEIGDIASTSGNALSFNSQQTQSGKSVSLSFNNANLLAGYGISTADSSDDVGLAITHADVSINLNADSSYDYSVINASAAVRGIDGVTLTAGSVSATGDQASLTLSVSNADLEIKDVINLKASTLNFKVEDTGVSQNVTLSGAGISAFAGYGAETSATADDIGLAIDNASFNLQLNADQTYSYALTNAAVDVRGVSGLTLHAGTVSVSGDHTGTDLNISLTNAVVDIDNVMQLSGASVQFTTEGTGANRTVNFSGTGLSAFAGYGAKTADISDDIGLALTNADFNLQLKSDRTYSYGLANAAVQARGIPGLTLEAGNVSAIGTPTSTSISLSRSTLGIGSVFEVGGELVEFQIVKAGAGQSITFNGKSLSAFAGYGISTPSISDDTGLAVSNADFNLLLNADKTYSYTLNNADIAARGVPGLTASAADVHVAGDQSGSVNFSTASFALSVGNVVGISGDALAISLQNGQPITISASNASALVGYGAATSTANDDLGLSISGADINVKLKSDQTYSFSVNHANAGLVGMEGLTLFAQQVNVTGDQTTVNVATGAFELGLDGVGYIGGTALAIDPADTPTDPLRIAATGIRAFVGSGGKTVDESGIKLSNGNLGLVLYQGATSSYALIADGQGGLVGVDDLSLDGNLAVRINRTGHTVNESVALGNGSTFDVIFGQGQENQLRVEGSVHANVVDSLAFGGEFSLELFTDRILGNLNQTSTLSNTSFNLAEQQVPVGESFYQQLLTTLATEKARLEGINATVKAIQATVDGLAFNENYVDILGDRLNFQTNHRFVNGQKVIYQTGGNTAIGGLQNGQEYYVVSANGQSLQLASALNGTAIDLTSAGVGTQQLSQVLDFTATNQIRVDLQQETILFNVAHGLVNGSRVRYDAANNPPIGGLKNSQDYLVEVVSPTAVKLKDLTTGAIVDLTSDSQGNHLFRPVILSVGGNGSNGGVNVDADTIVFATPHNLQTGDEIQYYRPYRGQVVGGTLDTLLTRQDVYPYKVQVVSPTEIKLLKNGNVVDLTSVGKGLHVISLIEESNGDRSHLTFHSPTTQPIQFVNSTTIKLSYAHGLTTGQTVTLQLDPGAAYPKTPIAGLNAVAYSTQPKVYDAASNNIYYVKVGSNGSLQFAASAQDLAASNFIAIQAPSGKAGSGFRLMPTWSFGSASQPGMTEQLGAPVAFTASNHIEVDVASNTLILPTTIDLKPGEKVQYRSGGTTPIGGLQDGSSYYVVSNLNGSVKLSATVGSAVIDLTTAGGSGNHSFVRTGIDFLTNNDIARQRRDAAVSLQERLSRDLGIQVTLTSGTATEAANANDRGVKFHDISVTYDEEQKDNSKLLAGITNGYAFMGTGYNTPDETGIKITDVELGLALYKTIDYSKPIAAQEKMTYALVGGGTGAIVGISDVTLQGTLGIQLNRTGTTVDETITTTGGDIQIQFNDPTNFTRITGTADINIAGTVALSGSIGVEQTVTTLNGVTTTDLLLGATDVTAFLGAAYGTPNEVGVKLTEGSLGLVLQRVDGANPSSTYALKASGIAGLVGVDGVTLTGAAAIAINKTGAAVNQTIATPTGTVTVNLGATEGNLTPKVSGTLDLGIDGVVALSGDFGIEKTADTLRIGAVNVDAFMGANSQGLQVTDAILGLVLNTNTKGYALEASGTAALVGINGLTLSGTANLEINRTGGAVNETIATSGGNVQVTYAANEGNILRASGLLDLAVDGFASLSGQFGIQKTADTLLIGATNVNAFLGANNQGLTVGGAELGLVVYTSAAGATYALDASGTAALVGVNDLTVSGTAHLELNRTGGAVNETIATPTGTVAIAYTADEGNISRAIGSLTVDVAGFAQLSGDFGFEKSGNTLRVAATDVSAFMGANGTGLQVNDANLGLVIYNDITGSTYALAASGAASVTGVSALTLSGNAFLEVNRTGRAVNEIIATAGGNVALDYTSAEGNLTQAIGALNLDIAGYASLSGDFGFKNNAGVLQIGATHVNALVGASGTGLQVSDAKLGLAIYSTDQTYALNASGTAALVGVDGITVSGTAALELNRTGRAVNETIATAGGNVAIAYTAAEGNVARAIGSLDLDIAGYAQLSGDFGFEQDGNTLKIAATNIDAFLGANGTGLQVNNANLGIVVYSTDKTYALAATGTASLLGVNGVTLTGNATLELNRTGGAVSETIATANGNVALNYTAAEGIVTRAIGSLDLNIAGFAQLSGDFGFEKNGDILRVGATDVNAFVGANNAGLEVKNGSLGLVVYSGSAGSGYALTASGTAGLVGVNDLTLSGTATLELNRTGQAVNEIITTAGSTVAIAYTADEGNITRTVGNLNLDVAGFAQLSGEFGFEQNANMLRVGARNVNAFVGANGSGVQLSDASLGLVLNTTTKTYALEASGTAELVGINDITLSGTVALEVNRTGQIVNELIAMPGDDILVNINTADSITRLTGTANLNVGNFVDLSGAFAVEKKTTTSGNLTSTQLLLGLTEVNAFVGSGYGSSGATGVQLTKGNLGLVFEQKLDSSTGTKTQGYALQGSGSAGLVGIPELTLTGDLDIAMNRLGHAVDVTIATPTGQAAVKFTDATNITTVTGIAKLGIAGVIQASGQIGFEKTSSTTADVTSTKLLVGIKDANAFVGAEGGTLAASGIQLSNGNLGLAIYSEANQTTKQTTSSYALVSSGSASLVGVNGLTLDGSLAVRVNKTGKAINETVAVSGGQSVNILFNNTQKNQFRVEGTAAFNAGSNVAFGGEFSMELFTLQTPGALGQSSNPTVDNLLLTKHQTLISEELYQDLRTQLAAEKNRLAADQSTVKTINATVDGFAFNEDRVDVTRDRLLLDKPHGLTTGQKVIYTAGSSNQAIGGLVSGQEYYVVKVDDQTLQLASTQGGSAIDLTSAGTGNQSLQQVIEFGAANSIHIDLNQDLILFTQPHGLTNMSRVIYDAGQNAAIGGLINGKQYTVQVIDAKTVKLRELNGSAVVDLTTDSLGNHTLRPVLLVDTQNQINVDLVQDRILFANGHSLSTGMMVRYDAQSYTAIGGLTNGALYYVKSLDANSIQLSSTKGGVAIDLTSDSLGNHSLTPISQFGAENQLRIDVVQNTILFPSTHTLAEGQTVRYEAQGNRAIGGLSDRAIYTVHVLNGNTIQLRQGNQVIDLTTDSVGEHALVPVLAFATENGYGNVSVVDETITFAGKHFLQTGDKLDYYSTLDGSRPVGGTFDALYTNPDVHPFYVIRVSDTVIKLAKTRPNALNNQALDLTSIGRGLQTMTLVERANGDRSNLTFQLPSTLSASGSTLTLNYAHGFQTGQGVVLQLDSMASVPKSPLSGVTADTYKAQARVYRPNEERTYYVKRISNTQFQLAETLADLENNVFVNVSTLSGASKYRFMPAYHFAPSGATVVDVSNDQIIIEAGHGFSDGTQVKYEVPAGEKAIGGLTAGANYYVKRVSSTTIQLSTTLGGTAINLTSDGQGSHLFTQVATTFDAQNHLQIDVNRDQVLFSTAHGFTTGTAVRYEIQPGQQAIGGLTAGQTYYIKRISDTAIQLTSTVGGAVVDLTSDGKGIQQFTRVASTFLAQNTLRVNVAQDQVQFVSPHGLKDGATVRYELDPGQTAIGGLTTGQTYTVKRISDTAIQLLAALGGSAVDLTSDGRGNHRLVQTGATFDADNQIAVDVNTDTIFLPTAVDLQVGDEVMYRTGGATAIGGLQEGTKYYVVGLKGTALQLAATPNGTVINLTAAGGAGNHQFIESGVKFLTGNDTADQRRTAAVALAERLSHDLGVTVNLTAGNATSTNDPAAATSAIANGRNVSFRNVAFTYDEQQLEKTKLLAGITNGYAFMGSGFGTPNEIGVKINQVDLGLALFKTIDYTLPLNQQPKMGYALTGKGAAAIVGVPDLTLEGTLDIQLNRSGQAVNETITTPGGSIQVAFAQPDDVTRINGTAKLQVSDYVSLSGAFNIEKANNQLKIGGTNITAFAGVGLNTPITTDNTGLSLSQGSFDFTLNDDKTYSYNATGTVSTVGMDFLKLSGTAIATGDSTGNLDVALKGLDFTLDNYAKLSGDFTYSVAKVNNARTIKLGATNASAFVGLGAATPGTTDDTGLSLVNAGFDFTLKADRSYSYNANGTVAAVGMDFLKLSGTAIATGDSTGNVSAALNNLNFTLADYAQLSGDFNFSVVTQNGAQTVKLGATGATAFVGIGAATSDPTDDVGLRLSNSNFNFTLNPDKTYKYDVNGNVTTVGLNLIDFTGNAQAIGDNNSVKVKLNQLNLNVSDYVRLSGDFDFSIATQNGTQIIDLGTTGASALFGTGAKTADTTDDFGLSLSGVAGNLQIRKPQNGARSIAYSIDGNINLVGINQLSLGGKVSAQLNQSTADVILGGKTIAAGINQVTGKGISLGIAGPPEFGLDSAISGDVLFKIRESDGTILAAVQNVNAKIKLTNVNVGGSVDGTSGQTGNLEGNLINGTLGLVLLKDGQYALKGSASASLVLGGTVEVGGDLGIEVVNINEATFGVGNPFSINEAIAIGNQSIAVSYTGITKDLFNFTTSNLYIDLILSDTIKTALRSAAGTLDGVKQKLSPQYENGKLVSGSESLLSYSIPLADTSLDKILGVSNYLSLGSSITEYLDKPTAPNTQQTLLGLMAYLKEDWLPTLPIYQGLDFVYDKNAKTLALTYKSDATYKTNLAFNLGAEAKKFGLEVTGNATVELAVNAGIDFALNFGWGSGVTTDFTLNKLNFNASASVNDLVFGAYLGPLEASLGSYDTGKEKGKVSLAIGGGLTYTDHDSNSATPKKFNFTVNNGGTISADLPFYASLAGKDLAANGTPRVLLNGSVFTTDAQGKLAPGNFAFTTQNFDKLLNFRNFSIVDIVLMFKDMVNWAEKYRDYDVMKTSIPFVDLSLGNALDFASAINDSVISKIDFYKPRKDILKGDGGKLANVTVNSQAIQRFTDSDTTFNASYLGKYITLAGVGIYKITAVATNGSSLDLTQVEDVQTTLFKVAANPNLGSLDYVIHEKQEMIRSLQEFIVAVNKSGVLPVNVPLEYDPVANTFRVPFAFKQDLPVLSDLPLKFGMDLGDLSLSSSSKASLKAGVAGRIDFLVDFNGRTLKDAVGNPLKDGAGNTLTSVGLFLDNVQLKGDVSFDVTDLTVAAKLGFLGLTAGGAGTGSAIHVGASIATGLTGRQSLNDLLGGNLSKAFYLNVSGDAYARLKGLKVDAGFGGGFTISPNVELGVYLPNLLSPKGTQVVTQPLGQAFDLKAQISAGKLKNEGVVVVLPDVAELLSFKNLSFSDIIRGLRTGIDFLNSSLGDQPFYTAAIPVVDRSLKDTFTFIDDIAAKLQVIADNPAGALQEVESTIERILGLTDDNTLPSDKQKFSLYLKDNILNLHLGWEALFSQQFGFTLDLATLKELSGDAGATALDAINSLVDINSKATLSLEAIAKLNVDIGISLASLKSGSPEIFLYDYDAATGKGTYAQVGVRLASNDLNLNFKVGPMNLGTTNATVVLDGDGNIATKDYAGLLAGLDQKAGTLPDDGKFYIGKENFGDNFTAKVVGGFNVNLPIYVDAFGFKTQLDQPISVKTNPVYGDQGLTQLFKYIANSPDKGASKPIIMTFPDIRGAFGLLGGNFSVLAILNDPTVIIDGVDTAVGVLEHIMDSNLAQNVPLLGDSLARGAHFLRDIRQGVLADLRQKLSGKGKAIEVIRQTLWDVLGPSQLNLLLDRNGDKQITIDDVMVGWYDVKGNLLQAWQVGSNLPAKTDAIQFDVKLGGKIFGAGLDLPLDFNLPGFSLEVDGGLGLDLGWSFDFGFGISVSDTFYISTNKDPSQKELQLSVSAFLDGDASTVSTPQNAEVFKAKGQLLFFGADLVDNRLNNKASGIYGGLSLDVVGDARGRLTFNRLLSGKLTDLFKVDFGVKADLSLKTTLGLVGVGGLPNLRGDLDVHWDWQVGQAFKSPGVNIKNLEVDLGSYVSGFLKPIADKLHDTLDPLMPVVRVLNQKVPGLSVVTSDDTVKGMINLLMQLKGYSPIDWSFIDEAEQIYALSGALANLKPGDWLAVGDIMGLGTAAPTSIATTQTASAGFNQIDASLKQNTRQDAKTSGTTKTPRSGFQVLPYLKDVSNWMKVLSGGDATLFTYEMPLIQFQAELKVLLFSYGIPGIASIDINAIARLSATADLGFGYDTYGIRKAIDTGNPLYALDGFYVMDWDMKGQEKPEFKFKGSIGIQGELNVFVASIAAEGLISLNLNVDLQDIEKSTLKKDAAGYVIDQTWKGDGKIRGSEIYTMLTYADDGLPIHVENLINIDGSINFELNLVGKAFGIGFSQNLLDIELYKFKYDAPKVQPKLAEVINGVLYLNSGDRAAKRKYGDLSDGGESFSLYTDKKTGSVGVEYVRY